jgi:flavin-dependent dehydrogenase
MTRNFDVFVVGGGPGGSSAATMLARQGLRVLLLEREVFPRFHIGESQLPWINGVLETLGADHLIKRAGFVEKWGASFTTIDGSKSQYADFARAVEVPRPQTYQVPRAEFDRALLDHTAACGATVMQGCTAKDAAFDADGVTLTYTNRSGETITERAAVLVDASGRAGFMAKRFGERRKDPVLQNISVHRQYVGIPRAEGRRAGDIRMVTRPDKGWFWFIPIDAETISVGVVIPQAIYRAAARSTPEATLDAFIAESPAAAELVAKATPVSEARFDADYSYLHSAHAGDRFVLVGDAGAFLDPIFSTGVLMAMQSGIEAAAVISRGLKDNNLGAARFAEYERTLVARYHHFRRFASGFYDPAFRDLFFSHSARFGIYEAVLSVLGGNWRPSWRTRLRLNAFFFLVALQRFLPIADRHPAAASMASSREPMAELPG